MKLGNVPFDGLYVVYKRAENGDMIRLFNGFKNADIPEKYADAEIIRIYPFDDSIIIEIK